MTLPRYAAICDHWRHTPPLATTAAIIARRMGAMKAAEAKPTVENQADKRQQLLDLLGGSAGFSKEKPAWLTKT
jgi:hypothetical protein